MKKQQRVMITSPELFLAGRTDSIYGLFEPATPLGNMPAQWIDCGVVEFEIPDSVPAAAIDLMLIVIESNERSLNEELSKLGKTKSDLLSNSALIAPTPADPEMYGE